MVIDVKLFTLMTLAFSTGGMAALSETPTESKIMLPLHKIRRILVLSIQCMKPCLYVNNLIC